MTQMTVVGGGLAGLIAACEVAEAGRPVRVLEARRRLGGRATSTPAPYVANLGPHALYSTTELWRWLKRRGLHRPSRMPKSPRIGFRWEGAMHRLPPAALMPVVKLRTLDAPVDADLGSWLTGRFGKDSARAIGGVSGPLTFDHDPGRLSAAFVVERIRRILLSPAPTARYVGGGWGALVERLAEYARTVGVTIETGSPVEPGDLDDLAPVIVAVEPGAARRLLREPELIPEAPRVALLDVGLRRRHGDPYVVFDLDEAAFVTRTTAVVPALAPNGEQLVQLSVGLRPGEDVAGGEARLEAVLDLAFTAWRDRVTWRRRAVVRESTGALDLPGSTWRDRTAIAYSDGVWLAGDWVAAPGHLAEVSCTSAVVAASAALAAVTRSGRPAASRR